MRARTFVFGLMPMLFLTSCAAPPPGTPVTHATACDPANHDQRVSIVGYPRLAHMTLVTDDFSVDLFEKPGGQGEAMTIYLTVGTGANQAEDLPDDYSDEDLRIHTSTNEVVSADMRIRVHGMLVRSEPSVGEVVCFINAIDLIEAAPEASS